MSSTRVTNFEESWSCEADLISVFQSAPTHRTPTNDTQDDNMIVDFCFVTNSGGNLVHIMGKASRWTFWWTG